MVKRFEQTIQLDCAPGSPRPDDLIGGVIEGLNLPERDPVVRFFGEWTWDYQDIEHEEWVKINPTLIERISNLYHQGAIRYGSW